MFGFPKRARASHRAGQGADTGASPSLVAEHHGWNQSADELRQGADVVEIDGDFAATVFMEHFEGAAPLTQAH